MKYVIVTPGGTVMEDIKMVEKSNQSIYWRKRVLLPHYLSWVYRQCSVC